MQRKTSMLNTEVFDKKVDRAASDYLNFAERSYKKLSGIKSFFVKSD